MLGSGHRKVLCMSQCGRLQSWLCAQRTTNRRAGPLRTDVSAKAGLANSLHLTELSRLCADCMLVHPS